MRPDGTAFVITPNAPADFENPFHVYLFEPAHLVSMLGLFFEEVECLGLDGDDVLQADFAGRRASGERILRLDPLDLRRRIPRRAYVWSYERALPVVYRLLGSDTSGVGSGIGEEHLFITPHVTKTTPVLFAVARGPRRTPDRAATMSANPMRTWITVPTYQEVENIDLVLRRVREAAPDATIVVVDDSSPDGTADKAEALAAEIGDVEVLRRPRKMGLGSAYRAGFAAGLARGYDVFVEIDADLSHDPADIPRLFARDRQRCRSRDRIALRRRRQRSALAPCAVAVFEGCQPLRRAGPSASRCATRRPDTARYRADTLRRVAYADARSTGYGFHVEMTHRVQAAGCTIVEVPICFTDRVRGESKMSMAIVAEAMTSVTLWGARAAPRGRQPSRLGSATVLWFEREIVRTLMDPQLDASARAAVESYVDGTLRSMPEHLRFGVAAESVVFGTPARVAQLVGRFDSARLERRVTRWKSSGLDPVRQYVRLIQSLVLFAENELAPAPA